MEYLSLESYWQIVHSQRLSDKTTFGVLFLNIETESANREYQWVWASYVVIKHFLKAGLEIEGQTQSGKTSYSPTADIM